jgi:hypothetical protein
VRKKVIILYEYCYNCPHYENRNYADESVEDFYCSHRARAGRDNVIGTAALIPDWCPLPDTIEALLRDG